MTSVMTAENDWIDMTNFNVVFFRYSYFKAECSSLPVALVCSTKYGNTLTNRF